MSRRRVPDWLTAWEYAHRGLHGGAVPENSLAGADAAIAAGLGVECDIQRSLDGVPMVFHDWNLKRLAGADVETEQLVADALEENFPLLGTNQYPVRLRRFLQHVGGRVPVLIEIKSAPEYDVELTCAVVRSELQSYSGRHAVMSFDPRVSQWFAKHSATTLRGLVMREDERGHTQTQSEREDALACADPDFLAYHIAALPNNWVADLRKGGLAILTWTVNAKDTRERALRHADALIAEGEGLA